MSAGTQVVRKGDDLRALLRRMVKLNVSNRSSMAGLLMGT